MTQRLRPLFLCREELLWHLGSAAAPFLIQGNPNPSSIKGPFNKCLQLVPPTHPTFVQLRPNHRAGLAFKTCFAQASVQFHHNDVTSASLAVWCILSPIRLCVAISFLGKVAGCAFTMAYVRRYRRHQTAMSSMNSPPLTFVTPIPAVPPPIFTPVTIQPFLTTSYTRVRVCPSILPPY